MSDVKRYDGYQAFQVTEDSTHSSNETLKRPLFVLASDYDAREERIKRLEAALQGIVNLYLANVGMMLSGEVCNEMAALSKRALDASAAAHD